MFRKYSTRSSVCFLKPNFLLSSKDRTSNCQVFSSPKGAYLNISNWVHIYFFCFQKSLKFDGVFFIKLVKFCKKVKRRKRKEMKNCNDVFHKNCLTEKEKFLHTNFFLQYYILVHMSSSQQ